jgi:hypothetical protein
VTGRLIKVPNEELQDLYSSPVITRMIKSRSEIDGTCRANGREYAYRLSVGNPERRRLLGPQRRRWVDNIKMDLVERVQDGVDLIGLAQDRYRLRDLGNTGMNIPAFHKMLGNHRMAAQLVASRVVINSTELDRYVGNYRTVKSDNRKIDTFNILQDHGGPRTFV